MKLTTEEDLERYVAEQAALFAGAHYGSIHNVEAALVIELQKALDDGPEESIQQVLAANPYLLQYAMPNTGHHGGLGFSKADDPHAAGRQNAGSYTRLSRCGQQFARILLGITLQDEENWVVSAAAKAVGICPNCMEWRLHQIEKLNSAFRCDV